MRKFAFVVLNDSFEITDKINLDLVGNPKGMGWNVSYDTIKTDIEEDITNYEQDFKNITMNINLVGNAYLKAKTLSLWLSKNINNKIYLQHTYDLGIRYAKCVVTDFTMTEKNLYRDLEIPITIKRLSPFFEIIRETISIYPTSDGKTYPYTYPYTYGSGVVENNEIENNYIKPIPLIIRLYGEMASVFVGIREKGASEYYGQVSFGSKVLQENEWIEINAIKRKITYYNGTTETDGYYLIDPTNDSYIYAEANMVSEIIGSIQSDKTGKLEARYLRYML